MRRNSRPDPAAQPVGTEAGRADPPALSAVRLTGGRAEDLCLHEVLGLFPVAVLLVGELAAAIPGGLPGVRRPDVLVVQPVIRRMPELPDPALDEMT